MNVEMIKELLNHDKDNMLSLYLNVDASRRENQAATPAWRIELKNMLKEAESTVNEDDLEEWAKILARVDGFFDTYNPDTKALAVFFTPDDQQVFTLPLPIESQSSYGEPFLMPLLWALDEYKTYMIVMVDHEKAKIITAFLGGTEVEEKLQMQLDNEDWREKTIMPITGGGNPVTGGGDHITHGSHVDEYQDRIREQTENFFRDVVEQIQDVARAKDIDRIIIAGNEEAAHGLRRQMHEPLSTKVIDVIPIPMRTDPNEVLSTILPTALEYERNYEMELVREVINLAKSGGRGALGHDDVMEAMRQQRVELLIVPRNISDHELRFQLPKEILNSGGELEIIHGEAAERLREEGELAARLYYAI